MVRQQAIAQAAATDVIQGRVTDPNVVGSVIGRVGDYPGQRWGQLTVRQQTQVRTMMAVLQRGGAYACPAGSGDGNGDIAMGAQITVRDGRGSVIARSTLSGGRLTQQGCTFAFSTRVSKAQVYRIRVAQRGALDFSRESLTASGWRVAIRVT